MVVKFKRLYRQAVAPRRGSALAAGFDLTAIDYRRDPETGVWEYGTGIAVELPPGCCALLMPRSSIYRTGAVLSNGVGLLDEDYRGEIKFKFYAEARPYDVGQRIGQLVVLQLPQVAFEEAAELSETERGTGGYGSTGL